MKNEIKKLRHGLFGIIMFTVVFSIVIVFQTNLKLSKLTKVFSINNMEEQKEEKGLLLGVGVLNRLHLKGRRDIIRMTWFQVCKKNPKLVRCNFFTDSYDGSKEPDVDKLLEEKRTHNDMLFMPITGKFFRFLKYFDSLRSQVRSAEKFEC